ncbi:MAG: hypothetical protein H7A43_09890 [Verrucomicrobia bacterium]|nr:hypothetical protein [Verrucomicrobiota bacterium]
MTLKFSSRFPGGNAAAYDIDTSGAMPEVRFTSDPCGGVDALWFHFRLEESAPSPGDNERKIRLVWNFVDGLYGVDDSLSCVPVLMAPGQPWVRLKQGEESRTPDGQRQLAWTLPYPTPLVEVALSFPYLPGDLSALLKKSREYWIQEPIGLTQGGRILHRLRSHSASGGGRHPGIYILARQHGGETPGSWVLDGLLRHFAQIRKGGYDLWVVPFADLDGCLRGHFGRNGSPVDLDQSWGPEPQRHEARVIDHDLQRWKTRCNPILALDLQSPGVSERAGVKGTMTGQADHPLARAETKWCNVFQSELQPAFAADDFKRNEDEPGSFTAHLRNEHQVPAVKLSIPYAHCGSNLLTQKNYREIGQLIAKAILRKNG